MSKEHVNIEGQEIGGGKGNFKPKKSVLIKVAIALIIVAVAVIILTNK